MKETISVHAKHLSYVMKDLLKHQTTLTFRLNRIKAYGTLSLANINTPTASHIKDFQLVSIT